MASYYLGIISQTLGKSFSLDIVLAEGDGGVIRAGQQMRGNVVMNVEQKVVAGGELLLSLRGIEKSIRKRGPIDGTRKHEFFSFSLPLCDMKNESLSPGTQSIPFAIDLPLSLPSSSMYRTGRGGRVGFAIQYKLTASLGMCTKTITSPVAAAATQRDTSSAPFTVHPTNQVITSMNGSKQGSVTLAASVQDTNITKGGKLVVSLSCRNDSLVSIKRIEVKMVELSNWGSKEGYRKTSLYKKTLAASRGDVIGLPGCQRENDNKANLVDTNYRTVQEQISLLAAMHNDLTNGQNVVELICPWRARDSHAGTLIDIRHYVKIKFWTTSLGSQPSLKIPLNIGLPDEIPTGMFSISEQSENSERKQIGCSTSTQQQTTEPVIVDDDDLPIASPVSPTSPSNYDQREKALEPLSPKRVVLQSNDVSGDVETDLRNLVPLLPPTLANKEAELIYSLKKLVERKDANNIHDLTLSC